MDAEIKSFLLQILKNQAEILSKTERLIANVESEYNENSVKTLNESWNNFSEIILTEILEDRENIETSLNNDKDIKFKFT